jgi:hypothetical protein
MVKSSAGGRFFGGIHCGPRPTGAQLDPRRGVMDMRLGTILIIVVIVVLVLAVLSFLRRR